MLPVEFHILSMLYTGIEFHKGISNTVSCASQLILQSHSKELLFNGLSQFFTFHLILSDQFRLQTVRRFPMGTHLSHTLHHFTNTCLPHGEPCFIKSNFILDSSFPCCAWLCCHTHVPSSCYASLPFCHCHAVASSLSSLLCLP